MKATVGVYENHEMALNAVVELKNAEYPLKHISILGLSETEVVDEDMHVTTQSPVKLGGLATGTVVGTAVGVLTGVGLFAIPGVGVLYGAGALVGAIAGFDLGLIGGGLASVVSTLGLHDDTAKKYHDELAEGKYLLVAHGTKEEVDDAIAILTHHAQHTSLDTHHSSFLKNLVGSHNGQFPLSGS